MEPAASEWVTGAFVLLPLLVAGGFVFGCDRAGLRLGDSPSIRRRRTVLVSATVLAWLVATFAVAASGVLRRYDAVPPPFLLLAATVAAIGIAVPCSPVGTLLARGLPIGALVGFQAFRLPLEVAMNRAAAEGVMPVQMSYSGRNFDVLTGATAALLATALLRGRVPRWIVACWNLLGLILLVNVVGIAILSTPVFRFFGDEHLNVFVTYPPFVWLPTVLVTAALGGHVLVARWLRENPPRPAGT